MTTLSLRAMTSDEFDTWRELYRQYCEFYDTDLGDTKADQVWDWVHDPVFPVEGRFICAENDVIGLVHFRAMPVPLAGAMGGFLDDLFVSPGHRGVGAAEFALRELLRLGTERGWVSLQWLTADDNYRARAVYDRLATRTSWLTYESDLG